MLYRVTEQCLQNIDVICRLMFIWEKRRFVGWVVNYASGLCFFTPHPNPYIFVCIYFILTPCFGVHRDIPCLLFSFPAFLQGWGVDNQPLLFIFVMSLVATLKIFTLFTMNVHFDVLTIKVDYLFAFWLTTIIFMFKVVCVLQIFSYSLILVFIKWLQNKI